MIRQVGAAHGLACSLFAVHEFFNGGWNTRTIQSNEAPTRFGPPHLGQRFGRRLSRRPPQRSGASAAPQSQVTSDVLKKIDQLVQQNEQLEKQNQDLVAEIKSLREFLADARRSSREYSRPGTRLQEAQCQSFESEAPRGKDPLEGEVGTPRRTLKLIPREDVAQKIQRSGANTLRTWVSSGKYGVR